MKIRYEHDGISLLTKCPHGMNPKVGSTDCSNCDHFGDWLGRNTILCNYKEEEVKIEELKKEVEELKAKIAEFENQEKDDDWVPERGQRFWFITNYGSVIPTIWDGCIEHKAMLSFHNVYPTREMAKSALHSLARCNAIIRACRLVELEFVPDWKNGDKKYYPFFDGKKWIVGFAYKFNLAPAYVSTREKCERVCALLEKWEVR